MRLIFAIATLSLFTLTAWAQRSGLYPTALNGTNGTANAIANAATNTYNYDMPCEQYEHVGVSFTGKAMAAHTGPVVIQVAKGVDDGVFESIPSVRLTNTMSGTTVVNYQFDVATDSAVAIRILKIENVTAVAVTNLTVKFRLKTPKRGVYSTGR